ncbi:MAG: hypothetical protein ABIN58_04005 [candidate division WOR-3 bacterium]
MLTATGFLFGNGVSIQGDLYTNPTAGTVLCDSGQLVGSNYLFGVIGYCSGTCTYDIEVRNAANTETLFYLRRLFSQGTDDFMFPNKLYIEQGQRIRVVLQNNVSGDAMACLFLLETG